MIESGRWSDYSDAREQLHHEVGEHATDFGFLGGAEEELVAFFYPDPTPGQTLDVLDKTLSTSPGNPLRRFQLLGEWLTAPASSPFYYQQYLIEHIWNELGLIEPKDTRTKKSIISAYQRFGAVLSQCAHYIPPHDNGGEDSSHYRLVLKIRNYIENNNIPLCLRDVWEMVNSREGRSRWFEEYEPELAYDYGDDPYKDYMKMGGDPEIGFITYTVHASELHPEFFPLIIDLYRKFGLSNESFSASKIEAVDLGLHATPQIKERLGYRHSDAVPAYRYQLKTTSDYIDSNVGHVAVDLIMPFPKRTFQEEAFPILFVLPRPGDPYKIYHTIAYPLNVRHIRTAFKAETGFDLLRYCFEKVSRDHEKIDPYFRADYQPFINNRRAFENKPQYDFPRWKGESLPVLGIE